MSVFRLAVGFLLGLLLFYWLFHNIEWEGTLKTLKSVDVFNLMIAFILMVASQFARAMRWLVIVRASFTAHLPEVFYATQIGLLVNFLVPARLGELIRSYVLANKSNVPMSQSIATIAIDRIFDVLFMIGALIWLSFFVAINGEISIPQYLTGAESAIIISSSIIETGMVFLGMIFSFFLLMLSLVYFRFEYVGSLIKRLLPLPIHWKEQILVGAERFSQGLHALSCSKSMFLSVGWSFIAWLLSYCAICFVLIAFNLDNFLLPSLMILILIVVFIAIPVAPGVIGQYHLAVIAGLLFFFPMMQRELLASIALIMHFITVLMVFSLGSYCLVRGKVNLWTIVHSARSFVREGK